MSCFLIHHMPFANICIFSLYSNCAIESKLREPREGPLLDALSFLLLPYICCRFILLPYYYYYFVAASFFCCRIIIWSPHHIFVASSFFCHGFIFLLPYRFFVATSFFCCRCLIFSVATFFSLLPLC